jgi:hypothetical protein
MQKTISLNDIIASESKFGCVLTYNPKKARDLKTLNPKSKFDTTYIPLLFKHINGKEMPVKIKFSEQIIGSSAKAPQGSDEEDIPKHLNISFMQMKRDDIEGGDYVPKKKDDSDLQDIEDKRVSANIDKYVDNNLKFIKVLNIIDASYKTVCADIKSKERTFSFRVKKDRKQTDITVFSIKQETRLDRDTNNDERLENPIFRLKVPVCKKDGRIGIWSNYNNKFQPTVFDARKMNKKNNYQPVPAKVVVDGKLRDLDVNSANSFITYKSLIGGTLSVECVVASKFGLSMNNSFYDLYVYRHKTKASQNALSKEDIIQMRGGASEDEEDDEDTVEQVNENNDNLPQIDSRKLKKALRNLKDSDVEDDDEEDNDNSGKEPVDSDEEEEEEEEEDTE